MWINFINLNGTDVEGMLKGKKERESIHVLCEPRSAILYQVEFNEKPAWVLKVIAEVGTDPKLHFTDEAKAKTCYDYLAEMLPRCTDDYCVEVDVLAHGAL